MHLSARPNIKNLVPQGEKQMQGPAADVLVNGPKNLDLGLACSSSHILSSWESEGTLIAPGKSNALCFP